MVGEFDLTQFALSMFLFWKNIAGFILWGCTGNKKNSFAIKNPVSNLEQGAGFEPATTQPTQAMSSVLTELPLPNIYE